MIVVEAFRLTLLESVLGSVVASALFRRLMLLKRLAAAERIGVKLLLLVLLDRGDGLVFLEAGGLDRGERVK